ncbi:hypothetical protein EVAR_17168_1 [Eumeta japonica]|uniref:Uncharacterized protein n=1 Tax=Eumeta variegata TaxID=151549 RepID=A0A4C1UA98_EUMVA|nr:hypothetical protein EVAR_17168_1 [Eumeta japonica]
MDTHNSKKDIDSLPASCDEIAYLMKGNRVDGKERGWSGPTRTLTNWMKHNNGIYYFTTVFCKSVVFHRLSRSVTIFVLQSRWPHYGSTRVKCLLQVSVLKC